MRRRRIRNANIEAREAKPALEITGLHSSYSPVYNVLGDADADRLIEATFTIMREAGVGFEPDPRVMALFSEAGCDVSEDGLVKFPTEVVKNAFNTMAKSVRVWNRPGTHSIQIDNEHTWFIPGMTCIKVYDDETGDPRDGTRDDLARITRVADALPYMDAVCITCKNVERSDIHGEAAGRLVRIS